MTYLINDIQKVDVQAYQTSLSYTGNVNISSAAYLTIGTPVHNSIDDLSQTSNAISLPAGCYLVEASLGVINSQNPVSNALEWKIELGGTENSNAGASISNNKAGVDCAVSDFTLKEAQDIKIKITSVAGTCSISTDYSYLTILRTG